jgi:dCMP deaminase
MTSKIEKQHKLDQVRLKQCNDEADMSKCVKHSVGCIITDKEGKMVASGYNGTPRKHENCCDVFPNYKRDFAKYSASSKPEDKEKLMAIRKAHREWSFENEIHAEVNAIMHSDLDKRKGGTLYVSLQPCPNCAKMIAASGVARVVYSKAYHRANDAVSQKLFKKSSIEYKHVKIDN